jgi:hypothetical protein
LQILKKQKIKNKKIRKTQAKFPPALDGYWVRWCEKMYNKKNPGNWLPMDSPIHHREYFYHELLVNPVSLGDPTLDITGGGDFIYI